MLNQPRTLAGGDPSLPDAVDEPDVDIVSDGFYA